MKLREPRYYDSPDSLNLIDLTPPKPKEAIDPLRRFLQNALPARLLDAAGREQREVDVIGLKNSRTSEFFLLILTSNILIDHRGN